jgi:hypothetical protein
MARVSDRFAGWSDAASGGAVAWFAGARERVRSAALGRLGVLSWREIGRADRFALGGLMLVLLAGLVLRVLFMLAWGPAFMGYSDSSAYLGMASGGALWGNPLHPVGYPVFLLDAHAIVPTAWFVIGLQHLFGLCSAVLIWLTVRRAGAPRIAALLPAAVVALNGAEMFLEHSILSEPLFILLISICLYSASRAASPPSLRWATIAALSLAVADTVRVTALPLLPLLVLWLLFGSGGAWRERARAAAVALACILAVVGCYVVVQQERTGVLSLTTPAGIWNLYGRIAPFADCADFTPPAGTRALCEKTPPAQRTNSVEQYVYTPTRSVALQHFSRGNGPGSATQAQDATIAAFTRAVIENQPLDYARTVLEGVIAYITPVDLEFSNRNELGAGYESFYHQILFTPQNERYALDHALGWYGDHSYRQNRSLLNFLLGYETNSRVSGALAALLMVLSLFAPFAPRGHARRVGTFLFIIAWVSLVTPAATHWWDARYAIPPLGPLSAAAAIGAWQFPRLAQRTRETHLLQRSASV